MEAAEADKLDLQDQVDMERVLWKRRGARLASLTAACQTDDPVEPELCCAAGQTDAVEASEAEAQASPETAHAGTGTEVATSAAATQACAEVATAGCQARPLVRDGWAVARPSQRDAMAGTEQVEVREVGVTAHVELPDSDDLEAALAKIEEQAAKLAKQSVTIQGLERALEATRKERSSMAEAKLAAERSLAELRQELEACDEERMRWSRRCKEALMQEATKILVSCPKVTLALGMKDMPICGQVDLDDVPKVVRSDLLPKYTTVISVAKGSKEDVHAVVDKLCQDLVADISVMLAKKVPAVKVNSRQVARSNSKGQ